MTCSVLSMGGCLADIGGWWARLVPDWVWPLLPYWPWMLGAVVLGLAYRLAGAPGLAVAAGAIGYTLGRRSVEQHEHVEAASPDALPPASVKPSARPRAAGVPPSAVRPPDALPPKSLTDKFP